MSTVLPMSKLEADRAAGRISGPECRPERPQGPADAATMPDDIPAVHILEAAQDQERKEAEELLSGFDRPGRGPQRPTTTGRDFVGYYARKSLVDGPRPLGPRIERRTHDLGGADHGEALAVAPGPVNRPFFAPWMAWAAASLGMLGLGGTVAFFATGDASPSTVSTKASTADADPLAAAAAPASSGVTSPAASASGVSNAAEDSMARATDDRTRLSSATSTTAAASAKATAGRNGSPRESPHVGSPSTASPKRSGATPAGAVPSAGAAPGERSDFARNF